MTDPTPTPSTPPAPRAGSRRARGATLCALLVLTLAVGLAARWEASGSPIALPGDGGLAVAAGGGPVGLRAHVDRGSVLRGSDGEVRVELVMTGEDAGASDAVHAVPTDLVVVLDRSGSMSGAPLRAATAAVRELVGRLAPTDRFALVTYASGARVAVPLEHARSGARERWGVRIARVGAGGGTNLSAGLDLAHQLVVSAARAGRAPRIVVLSDGHANQGDASLEGLRARAGRAVASEYVLSAAGVGQGFDETVMSAIADAGTGNFYYLSDAQSARSLAGVFGDEFAAARATVARALEVEIAPGDGVTVVSAAGYPLETHAGRVRFRPGDLFAGQERRVWLRLRVPTDREARHALGRIALAYTDEDGERRRVATGELPRIACVPDPDAYYASLDGESFRRGIRSEGLGALKERIAAQLRAGRQDEAVAEIDAYAGELEKVQRHAPEAVAQDDVDALRDLRETVAAPAAAEPTRQRALGKRYLEAGRDERRVGSKR